MHPTGLVKLLTREMALSGRASPRLSSSPATSGRWALTWTLRHGTRSFITRRARRLMSAYHVALTATALLALTVLSETTGTHWDMSVPFTPVDAVAHGLLVHDVIGDPFTISRPLWPIAVTWQLYPLLLLAARRWGIGRVAVWAVAITTLGVHTSP